MKKRRPPWEELGMAPPAKKSAAATAAAAVDPAQREAAQQQLRANCMRTLRVALESMPPSPPEAGGQAVVPAAEPSTSAAGGDDGEDVDLDVLADAIEGELFRRHRSSTGQEYKASARVLVASLKRNADLRRRVLAGSLRPPALVAMDARQLATSEQQEEYGRLQERATQRVTMVGNGAMNVTNDYKCARCGGNTCDYHDSGRRDIGKSETWGSKDGQTTSRLVSCLGCGFRWEVDDV